MGRRPRRRNVCTAARALAPMIRRSARPERSLIFLIRPDGVGTYDSAALEARKMKTRNGKLPLPGFGAIDFGAFGQ